MAAASVKGGLKFPEGTVLAAYPASNWSPTRQPPSGAPEGSSSGSATVTNGTAAFTGLAPKTRYYAYALVNSEHRYVHFTTTDLTVAGEATSIDQGFGGEWAPYPLLGVSAQAATASRVYVARFVASRDRLMTKIAFWVQTFSATDDAVDGALLDETGARLTPSNPQTGKVNATNGRKLVTLGGSGYQVRKGSIYYAALAYGASAAPATLVTTNANGAQDLAGTTMGKLVQGFLNGNATIPASVTASSPISLVPIMFVSE